MNNAKGGPLKKQKKNTIYLLLIASYVQPNLKVKYKNLPNRSRIRTNYKKVGVYSHIMNNTHIMNL